MDLRHPDWNSSHATSTLKASSWSSPKSLKLYRLDLGSLLSVWVLAPSKSYFLHHFSDTLFLVSVLIGANAALKAIHT